MPNHITNIIKARPEVLKCLIGTTNKNETIVDFEKVISRPKSLSGVSVDGTEYIVNHLYGVPERNSPFNNSYFFDEFIRKGGFSAWGDEKFNNFIKMLQNIRNHGNTSWYDWSIENWGTKWNAYDAEIDDIDDGIIQFDTAWSFPYPVIETLSKMNPDDEIEVQYADEDIGHNLGHYIIKNGEIIKEFEIDDPILFAITIKGGVEKYPYYKLNPDTGKYEYDEDYYKD